MLAWTFLLIWVCQDSLTTMMLECPGLEEEEEQQRNSSQHNFHCSSCHWNQGVYCYICKPISEY